MPEVFSSSPGSVLVVSSLSAAPLSISVPELTARGTAYGTVRSILTSVGLSERTNSQFINTLRNFVYVYTFGDRPGDLVLSGLSFLQPCDGTLGVLVGQAGSEVRLLRTGFELLRAFYRRNRMSRRALPVNIAIGSSIALNGFLTGVDLVAQDPTSAMGQFSLTFKVFDDQDDTLVAQPTRPVVPARPAQPAVPTPVQPGRPVAPAPFVGPPEPLRPEPLPVPPEPVEPARPTFGGSAGPPEPARPIFGGLAGGAV